MVRSYAYQMWYIVQSWLNGSVVCLSSVVYSTVMAKWFSWCQSKCGRLVNFAYQFQCAISIGTPSLEVTGSFTSHMCTCTKVLDMYHCCRRVCALYVRWYRSLPRVFVVFVDTNYNIPREFKAPVTCNCGDIDIITCGDKMMVFNIKQLLS